MRLQRSRLIQSVLLGFIVGVWSSDTFDLNKFYLLCLLIFVIAVSIRARAFVYIGFLTVGILIGTFRADIAIASDDLYQNYIGEKVVAYGEIIDDPSYQDDGPQIEFHIGSINIDNQELPGRIRVRAFGAQGLRRGDKVEVQGKLRDGYGNRQGQLSFSEVTPLSRSDSIIEDIRTSYFSGVYTALPEPQASLGLGFLVGLRALLPPDLVNQLSIVGLTHIVAVSGYNLTILVRLSRRFFARYSKFVSAMLSLLLISGFLMITGFSPSIVRAAVVSILALFAWYYGREINVINLLLFGAALTILYSPYYIWDDIGWWLSFLAFAGVLVLAPAITDLFYRGENKPRIIPQTIIETFSAQMLALPLIVFIFGDLSLISVIANVLVLPLIPVAMLLTFVAGTVGLFAPSVVGWIAWPAKIILTYITSIVEYLAQFEWSLIEVEIDLVSFIAIMAIEIILIVTLVKRQKTNLKSSYLLD